MLCFEWKRSASENLLSEEVRSKIFQLIRSQAVAAWGAAPICSSFSVAVTPPVRSPRYPRGLPNLSPGMRQKVRDGNSHNDFLSDLIDASEREREPVLFWQENPDTSWWWRQRRFSAFRHPKAHNTFRCCFCRFGTAWRKATRFATNIRGLMGLRMMCRCAKRHLVLRGQSPYGGKPWTLIAEPYPRGLCELLAKATACAVGWYRNRRLDVAKCSKTGTLRAGEAKTPGPRRPNKRREGRLEDVQLLSTATLMREARTLKIFLEWAAGFIHSMEVEEVFQRSPSLLVCALCCFGKVEYNAGGALSNFRHLVLSCQKWTPLCRPLTAPCWDLISKWERVEPVTHRVPVPEGLVKALVVVAWHLRWYSWAGVTLLAFYGAGRVGEVLKCRREDLLMPKDLMDVEQHSIYLRLAQFKALGRQSARIQHMEVSDEHAVKIICAVFSHLPASSSLFVGSPSSYRRRWDALLELCQLPTSLRLTPGGLRGGAAVTLYRKHVPIGDILWRLRLRAQTTLESYLQEMAASAVFSTLHPRVRERLFSFGTVFSLLG